MVTGSSGAIGLRKCIEVTCLENLNVDTGAHSFIIFSPTNDSWSKTGSEGVANGTSKNVGLGKFWQDLEISEAFLISLEVSFFHGLLLLFLSLETFHQRVSSSDF